MTEDVCPDSTQPVHEQHVAMYGRKISVRTKIKGVRPMNNHNELLNKLLISARPGTLSGDADKGNFTDVGEGR